MADEELIAWLREIQGQAGLFASAAADRIAALTAEVEKLRRFLKISRDEGEEALIRAERLEAAATAVADDVCSYICPSIGLAGRPIPHDPRCIALRAALEPVTVGEYILAPHLQKIVDSAKASPQWDTQADRLAALEHVSETLKTEHDAGNVLTPAPDATAIREDSPNHAYRVGYAAGRAAALREAAATVQAGDTVQNIQRRILALIDKR